MSAQISKGIKLLEDIPGNGPAAEKGDIVAYNARFFLRKGDEVTPDTKSIAAYRSHLHIRVVNGVELIDHTATLGKRQLIAGVEKALYGMRTGGYREVLVSPHLGYGKAGVDDSIPANAMLRILLWVRDVQAAR